MPFQVTQRTIKDMINDNKVAIPPHQRNYVWKPRQASAFLETIMDGMPTLSLILYEEVQDGKVVRCLEDGQQRFMTVKKFFNNEFGDKVKWQNKKFEEFSADEQSRFLNYPFTVTVMEDISYQRRVALFQAIQDGTPLTNGQRFYACSYYSPVVKFAKQIIHDEKCIEIWGEPKNDDKKKSLANAVAIASGLAFNNINAVTNSYDILGNDGYLTKEFSQKEADKRLNKLLDVYKRADEIYPTTPTIKKQQFDVGKYTGYIFCAMFLVDRNWQNDLEMFAQFIAKVRRDKEKMKVLSWNKPATRNWNYDRWKQGIWNLENQEVVEKQIAMINGETDESEEE